jgi:hypothetical protein
MWIWEGYDEIVDLFLFLVYSVIGIHRKFSHPNMDKVIKNGQNSSTKAPVTLLGRWLRHGRSQQSQSVRQGEDSISGPGLGIHYRKIETVSLLATL